MEALADADLVLVVLDASQPIAAEDRELLSQVEGRAALVVENKCDWLTPQPDQTTDHGTNQTSDQERDREKKPGSSVPHPSPDSAELQPRSSVQTSALTGAGIPELRAAILARVGGDSAPQIESGFLTNVRHQKLINDALTALNAAAGAVSARVPHEMLLLDIYSALRALDEITGVTATDDILNLIFGTFCIGK